MNKNMDKKEIEKYKIRDYYMIPIEVIDNIFYVFEQQVKNQQEVIDKIKYILDNQINYREFVDMINDIEDVMKRVLE